MFRLVTMNLVTDFITPERISLAVRVLLILVIGIPIVKLIMKLIDRLMKDKLSLQAEVLIGRFVKYVLYLLIVVMVLNEFGFKISALLGAAGIFGVAIGFASQTSVSNIISGIFLISEKPFVIGDVVEVGGKLGTIDSIDLLSIKLRTFDGLYVRIPNETMIKNDVTNYTRFDIRRAQFVIGIAYKENIHNVLEIIKDVVENMPDALKEPAPLLQLKDFGASSVDINIGVWTATSNVVNMKTELMLAVKERLDREGIEIAIPHISLRGRGIKTDKGQHNNQGSLEKMNKNPQIKAVIFDLDGTLLDTIKDIAGAINKGLTDLGYPTHPVEDFCGFVGHGQAELVTRALPEKNRSAKDIKALSKKFWDYYDIEWYLNTKTYPGVLYMIQLAVGRKIKLAILSNKAHYFTKKMIRHFFRGAMIRHTKNPFGIYSGEQTDRPTKPDPTLALELAEKLKISPEYIAFLGDMPVDIQTAKNAGMLAVGAAWGFSGRKILEDAGADMVFDSPTEFAAFLETQPII